MSSKPHERHPGDDGHSDLLSDKRPPKNDPVFECLGWLDELNAAVGQLRVAVREQHGGSPHGDLRGLQLVLGRIMGQVANAAPELAATAGVIISDSDVTTLERLERDLRSLTTIEPRFYLPGDTTAQSALADVARARCRTAERALVTFMTRGQTDAARVQHVFAPAERFLNRLSDYLFTVARYLDAPE